MCVLVARNLLIPLEETVATQINYSPADRRKLTTFEWNGRGSTAGALRALKMVAPRCQTCQTPETVKGGSPRQFSWMKDCVHGAGPAGAEPYFSLQPKVIKTPKLEPDEDGDLTLVETAVRTKMIRVPNIVEIPISERFEDGEAVQKAASHGFKVLPDVGLAPMCEMYGCGKAWPTVGTDFGAYCSEVHAGLCIDDADGVMQVVYGPKGRSGRQTVQEHM